MMQTHLILMYAVAHAFPQEWTALLPVVEFLYHTAPQGAHGLSAHDLSCGFAVAQAVDDRLKPFVVAAGAPETEIAARLFTNFRMLYGLFNKIKTEEALKAQMQLNISRHARTFEPGDTVFRRLPIGARLPKHSPWMAV